MLVGKQHGSVDLVQIGRGFHGFERRVGDCKNLALERLSLFDQSRCFIGRTCRERFLRFTGG